MKRTTCISTLIALVLSTLTNTTSACPSECDTNDQACMNALLACVEESNTDATAEMAKMIKAQQAFSGSSRMLQAEADITKRLMG